MARRAGGKSPLPVRVITVRNKAVRAKGKSPLPFTAEMAVKIILMFTPKERARFINWVRGWLDRVDK